MNDHSEVSSPVLKFITMWAMIGITSWADFAAFLGAVYSGLLILEWIWKKIIRPIAVDRGWIKQTVATNDAAAE